MSTGIGKSKASGIALMGKVLVGVMMVGMMPQALAASGNAQLEYIVLNICNGNIPLQLGWNTTAISAMCVQVNGGAGGATNTSSVNLGTAYAGGGMSTRKQKKNHESDNESDQSGKAASADTGGWGVLVTPQYSKTSRVETELENGYQSNLKGLVIGVDYRFTNSFLLGLAVGQTKDEAIFLNGAGFLKSSTDTVTLYSTWMVSEETAIDGYLGFGKIDFNGQRHVAFDYGAGIFGTTASNTAGRQELAGMSVSTRKALGQINLSPFISLDYIKTKINGYTETGTTTLEMRYGNRRVASLTSSLGARAETDYGYTWGVLLPSIRLVTVHEFQNNSQQLSTELASTPGFGFAVFTDAPDRNYLIAGVGITAAMNSGAQIFIDYEKRNQDRLMRSWAASAGVLVGF
jgi:uncharacterized protein YhjY with autotransporter beta-barrel domain